VSSDDGRGDRYADRFAEAAAQGQDVHGEASFVHGLAPEARVLDAGCGTGRVAIRLAQLGHDVVGVDLDEGMLDRARRDAPDLSWFVSDLAELRLADELFEVVLTAGNVISLVAAGDEARVVSRLAAHLRPGGLLVSGFGLDVAHLPLDHAPVTLEQYDAWCADAGLDLLERFATWDGDPYGGGGYAVSVHRLR
jgi:SAM-dependent methyltransferase